MRMECLLTVVVDTQLHDPSVDLKPIICNLCANCFLDITSFEDHYKTHLKKVDQCSEISNLQTKSQDISHVLKPVICKLCFECFQDTATFEDHYKLHLTDVDQSTVILNLQTTDPPVPPLQYLNPLVSRIDDAWGLKAPDDQKPDVCHEVFENDTLLQDHQRENLHIKQQFVCKFCKESFMLNEHLLSHIKTHEKQRESEVGDNLLSNYLHVASTLKNSLSCDDPSPQGPNLQTVLQSNDIGHGTDPQCPEKSHVRSYICKICNKEFRIKSLLARHNRTHKKIHKCLICGKAFAQTYELVNHCKRHIGDLPFACNVCKKAFLTQHLLDVHKCSHKKPLKCKHCDSVFIRKQSLLDHNQLQHGRQQSVRVRIADRSYSCKSCNETFSYFTKFRAHTMVMHENESSNVCKFCSKHFHCPIKMQNHLYRNHNIELHGEDHQHKCKGCLRSFEEKYQMDRHRCPYQIAKNKAYKASLIQRLLDVHKLNLNIELHGEDQQHKCKECQRSFEEKSQMDRHRCPYQMFKNKVDKASLTQLLLLDVHKLNRNIDLHDDDQQYKCKGCPRSFEEKYQMDRHRCPYQMAEKKVETVYNKCNKCEQTFTYQISLRYHRCTFTERKAS